MESPDPVPGIELLEGSQAYAAKALEMVAGAYKEIALLTQELDRRLYGTEAFVAALRKFVLQHEHTRCRILVAHPQRAMGNGSRLIEFGRAMSSRLEFRDVPRERIHVIREEYLVTDGRLLLYRETPETLEIRYYGGSPHLARARLREYDPLWNESTPSQELRRLS